MAKMAGKQSKAWSRAWKLWISEHGSRLYMYARQRCSCREDAVKVEKNPCVLAGSADKTNRQAQG